MQEYLGLVLKAWTASNVGKQLQDCYNTEERLNVIKHCVGPKSTNTLITRASPLRGYNAWVDSVMASIPTDFGFYDEDPEWKGGGWPPTESLSYKYVLSTKSASASRMFVESIGFLRGVFGFDFQDILSSQRIKGYAAIRMSGLGPIRKARAAPDDLLPKLEIMVCSKDMPAIKRIGAGNALIKIMTRTRNSDWRYRSESNLGEKRILAIVDKVKTSYATDREELALVGPVMSCTGPNWLEEYKNVRLEEGIPLEEGWPLLPARNENGWITKEATLTSVNSLYKEILATAREDPARITSHTWRRTGATIAAREGITREEQSIL